jgi:hypothetical protein
MQLILAFLEPPPLPPTAEIRVDAKTRAAALDILARIIAQAAQEPRKETDADE